MTGFEFVSKTENNPLYGIKGFEELLSAYRTKLEYKNLNDRSLYFQWLAICRGHPEEEIHSLFKDWKTSNRFEMGF